MKTTTTIITLAATVGLTACERQPAPEPEPTTITPRVENADAALDEDAAEPKSDPARPFVGEPAREPVSGDPDVTLTDDDDDDDDDDDETPRKAAEPSWDDVDY